MVCRIENKTGLCSVLYEASDEETRQDKHTLWDWEDIRKGVKEIKKTPGGSQSA